MNEELKRRFFDTHIRPLVQVVIDRIQARLQIEHPGISLDMSDAIATIYEEFDATRYTLAAVNPFDEYATDSAVQNAVCVIFGEMAPLIEHAVADEAKYQIRRFNRRTRNKK